MSHNVWTYALLNFILNALSDRARHINVFVLLYKFNLYGGPGHLLIISLHICIIKSLLRQLCNYKTFNHNSFNVRLRRLGESFDSFSSCQSLNDLYFNCLVELKVYWVLTLELFMILLRNKMIKLFILRRFFKNFLLVQLCIVLISCLVMFIVFIILNYSSFVIMKSNCYIMWLLIIHFFIWLGLAVIKHAHFVQILRNILSNWRLYNNWLNLFEICSTNWSLTV